MSAAAFAVTRQPRLRSTLAATRPWLDLSFAFGVLFLVTLGALAVDERVLNGISVWIKPLKFQASLALHFATLFLLARLLPEVRVIGRGFRGIVAASTAAALFEIGYIMLQAARGRASHFNNETVLESVMYALMGIGAVMLVVAPFMMGVWLWRDYGKNMRTDPLRLAAVLGLVLSAVTTLVIAGFMSSFWGSHWVGDATSDAGGLPLVGWSQQVGDLRVAHFFASHGLHVLPLLGYAVRNRAARGSLYVTAGTGAWLLLTGAVFIQALQGQPFLSLG